MPDEDDILEAIYDRMKKGKSWDESEREVKEKIERGEPLDEDE